MNVRDLARSRRTVRRFRTGPVSDNAIRRIIDAGRLAPSGANRQPWRFVVVDDPETKRTIREACERAELKFHARAPRDLAEWMAARGITPEKPFLEEAPYLICVFYDAHQPYPVPSTWIAVGFMLLQIAEEGLGTVTYTPAGADLNRILDVPPGFKLAVLLPIGRPADEPVPPPRRSIEEIAFRNRFGAPL